MKSAGISHRPSGNCFDVTRLPISADCIMPPVPSKSSWPIALPEYTANWSGCTVCRSTSQSMPNERTASEAPKIVSARPRGWLRD